MDIIQVIGQAAAILLQDKKCSQRTLIETYIYALQYTRFYTNVDNQTYAYAAEYVFKMQPKEDAMSFEQFGNYFDKRCQWYEELHCKIAKEKQEGDNMPIAWSIIQHLIYTFPLQDVNKKDVGQYAFTHTGFFENIDFIQRSFSMFSFIYKSFENNNQENENNIEDTFEDFDKGKFDSYDNEEDAFEGLDKGEYGNYDDYDDAEAAQIIAKQLIQKHGKKEAINIVEGILELSLITYNDNPDSQGAKSCIDKSCRLLDILRPIESGGWYFHCKNQEELADYLTIDYDCISDAVNLLKELSKQAMMRATGLVIIMTGPSMKIMAGKFYRLNNMYEKAIDILIKMQKHIAETSHKGRMLEDKGVILSSKMYSIDGIACGFISNGKIYLNSDMGNHKAPVHLYTYLWMKHCKNSNNSLYNAIIDLASTTAYFYHIQYNKRFADLDREEKAIKAICYMTAFDATDIFLDEKRKAQLMTSNLAEYETLSLSQQLNFIIDLTIDEAKRLPLISFIRGDKISDKDICGEIKFNNSKQ